jgi:hypothetical protein
MHRKIHLNGVFKMNKKLKHLIIRKVVEENISVEDTIEYAYDLGYELGKRDNERILENMK